MRAIPEATPGEKDVGAEDQSTVQTAAEAAAAGEQSKTPTQTAEAATEAAAADQITVTSRELSEPKWVVACELTFEADVPTVRCNLRLSSTQTTVGSSSANNEQNSAAPRDATRDAANGGEREEREDTVPACGNGEELAVSASCRVETRQSMSRRRLSMQQETNSILGAVPLIIALWYCAVWCCVVLLCCSMWRRVAVALVLLSAFSVISLQYCTAKCLSHLPLFVFQMPLSRRHNLQRESNLQSIL